MKWIGQNIYDYVSRFRNHVYISGSLYMGTSEILSDSSGTTTLKNIDALDATTEATIEAAIDTLANLTTAAGLTSIGSAGATTEILAGDLHMFNPVNGGNPIIRLGSSASNNLLIQTVYNSGVQTLDEVNFITVTSSGTTNDGRFNWYVDGVLKATLNDDTFLCYTNINANDAGAQISVLDTTTSSATEGGKLLLRSDDGAAMGDDHRLGVIEFQGAEDGSNTRSIGARIQAIARDAWDGSNNDADLEFYTTNGTTESKVLTLDADKLATFTGAVTVTGALTMPDDTVTFAKASGVSPNVYGSIIKLLPSDFAANIDGGNTKLGVGYTDTAGSAYGMKVGSASTELFAFVSIPEGMKATHVDVYDKDDRALEVFEVQINATSLTSKGSGNCNTTLDMTDVNATATNFLAIKVTTTATTDKVFGGQVTIAAQ